MRVNTARLLHLNYNSCYHNYTISEALGFLKNYPELFEEYPLETTHILFAANRQNQGVSYGITQFGYLNEEGKKLFIDLASIYRNCRITNDLSYSIDNRVFRVPDKKILCSLAEKLNNLYPDIIEVPSNYGGVSEVVERTLPYSFDYHERKKQSVERGGAFMRRISWLDCFYILTPKDFDDVYDSIYPDIKEYFEDYDYIQAFFEKRRNSQFSKFLFNKYIDYVSSLSQMKRRGYVTKLKGVINKNNEHQPSVVDILLRIPELRLKAL